MEENKRLAEQELKNEKQSIDLSDIAQELSESELEDVHGGQTVNRKVVVYQSRAARGRFA